MMKKPLWKQILFTGLALLCSLAAAEIAVRTVLAFVVPSSGTPYERVSQPLGYRLKPNYRQVIFHTNSQGFVGTDITFTRNIPEGYKRILIIGDSLSQGDHQTIPYPVFLGSLLNRQAEWEIINASVSGYSHRQIYERLRQLLADGWQADILIYGITPNDILPLESLDRTEALATVTAWQDFKHSAALKVVIKTIDLFLAKINLPPFLYQFRQYSQYCTTINKYYHQGNYKEAFAESIESIINLTQQHNITPYFLLLPQALDNTATGADSNARREFFINFFAEKNVNVVDSTVLFSQDNVFTLFVSGDPCHPNNDGQKLIAQHIGEAIINGGV